jgi:hypothetical protein
VACCCTVVDAAVVLELREYLTSNYLALPTGVLDLVNYEVICMVSKYDNVQVVIGCCVRGQTCFRVGVVREQYHCRSRDSWSTHWFT